MCRCICDENETFRNSKNGTEKYVSDFFFSFILYHKLVGYNKFTKSITVLIIINRF